MELLTPAMLRRYAYFSSLSDGALDTLSKRLKVLELPAGAQVIEEGTPAASFYFVAHGEVEVSKRTKWGHTAKLSVVNMGEGFGEVALLTCLSRSSSVRARTSVRLYALTKADFDEVLLCESCFAGMLQKRIEDYAHYNQIKMLQPFALLEPEKIPAITTKLVEKTYSPGQDIIVQGEKGDAYYIVKSGRVAVLVKESNAASPEQVAVLNAGEAFGEEALIRDKPRNATVRTLEPTTVLALTKADFDRLLMASYVDYAYAEDIPAEEMNRYVFIDARIQPEYEEEHIAGAVNIPLEVLRQKYTELEPTLEYLTYCTNDSRGTAAAFLLRSHGFKAKSIRGGLSAWEGPVTSGPEGVYLPKNDETPGYTNAVERHSEMETGLPPFRRDQ